MKLSIITVNLNNAAGLEKTAESIVNQTFTDFEWIVIDGGSTDGSVNVIRKYEDRITYWVSEKDTGIYNAMNKGVKVAKGEYCLFLNSGDKLHSDDVLISVTDKINKDSEDFIICRILFPKYNFLSSAPSVLTMNFFYCGSLPHCGTFIKTNLFLDLLYDESLRIVSDWKFFMQEIIFNQSSYRMLDIVVSDFDCEGISSDIPACDTERSAVLNEFFPANVLLDYQKFNSYNSDYDIFFKQLRRHRFSKVLYSLDVILLRILSVFRSEYKFARSFPIRNIKRSWM